MRVCEQSFKALYVQFLGLVVHDVLDFAREDFGSAGPFVDTDHGDSDGPGGISDGNVEVVVMGFDVFFEQAEVRDQIELFEDFFIAGSVDQDFEEVGQIALAFFQDVALLLAFAGPFPVVTLHLDLLAPLLQSLLRPVIHVEAHLFVRHVLRKVLMLLLLLLLFKALPLLPKCLRVSQQLLQDLRSDLLVQEGVVSFGSVYHFDLVGKVLLPAVWLPG